MYYFVESKRIRIGVICGYFIELDVLHECVKQGLTVIGLI